MQLLAGQHSLAFQVLFCGIITCCECDPLWPGAWPVSAPFNAATLRTEWRLWHAAAEVNSLTSSETELPYNYYTLPFCKPPEGTRKSLSAINPGTILMGSRIENSAYNFSMLVSCPARRVALSMNL